ncbi:quercetin 2,3-dioxygenase [Saccharothrix deserti]|uniref:quercetin 2,3-dioxygenase n=1 Tax=Saccharothrix deserti TaxID=2593674 RepID=UPI00131B37D6|nr:quercetin 2,3-dioxygenase [Saccharothrix deserti]
MSFDVEQFEITPVGDGERPQAIYLPPGAGRSVWAFSGDKYTVKAGVASTGGALGLMEAEIPPLSGPPMHSHDNEDEAFYILGGRIEVVADDRAVVAEPGSFIYIPRGAPHRFKNVGDDAARMLLLFLPSGFEEFFLEVGTPVVEGQQAPTADTFEARVGEAMAIAESKYGIVSH